VRALALADPLSPSTPTQTVKSTDPGLYKNKEFMAHMNGIGTCVAEAARLKAVGSGAVLQPRPEAAVGNYTAPQVVALLSGVTPGSKPVIPVPAQRSLARALMAALPKQKLGWAQAGHELGSAAGKALLAHWEAVLPLVWQLPRAAFDGLPRHIAVK
jgi:hypothetical protein